MIHQISGRCKWMALDVGIRIRADESVRLLLEITEGMDFEGLYAAYDRETRADEATPKQMYILVVLAFMLGIYSTRGMEAACRTDIRFMYVLGGKRVPDHSRFASFIRDRLSGRVGEDLFYQLVEALHERGEIRYDHLFVDGTKIEANANRYSLCGRTRRRNERRSWRRGCARSRTSLPGHTQSCCRRRHTFRRWKSVRWGLRMFTDVGSARRSFRRTLRRANEAISVTENAAALGLPIPQRLLDTLEQLKHRGEDDTDDGKAD